MSRKIAFIRSDAEGIAKIVNEPTVQVVGFIFDCVVR